MPQAKQRPAEQRSPQPRRPVHVVRYGNIKAAVWANDTQSGLVHNVTFARSYKDGEEWKESPSFGADDLLVVAKAAADAFEWIHTERRRRKSQQQQDEE